MCSIVCAVVGLLFSAELPIPDVTALMKEVQAHQKEMDKVRENYTFHRTSRVEELDAKGAVKKTSVTEREIFFVNGHQIGRIVKREGVALSPSEENKEQERARKLTLEFSKKPPAYGNGGGTNLIGMVLSVAEFSSPKRTTRNGRSTLTFQFKGNPKAQAHGVEEKGAKKLEGTVWIDEADKQVARLEVAFYDTFRVAGGLLASIQKGTVVKLEQAPIGDGLWMFTSNEQHMNLRVVTKSVHQNTYIKNFDFKKFNVDVK